MNGMANTNIGQNALINNPYDVNNKYGESQSNNQQTPPANPLQDFDSANFDVADPEQVRSLQQQMGVTVDGMFGPETEKAYRGFVNQKRTSSGQDAYTYDEPQKDGFGFGQMMNPFREMKENRQQGLGVFGKQDGFASGQGTLANWNPGENVEQGRGYFGKQDGFGSGQGGLSNIGAGGEGFMGKFGTGQGALANIAEGIGNFFNRNDGENNLNNSLNGMLGKNINNEVTDALESTRRFNNYGTPQFNNFSNFNTPTGNPHLTKPMLDDLGIKPNYTPDPSNQYDYDNQEEIPNWLEQRKNNSYLFGGR